MPKIAEFERFPEFETPDSWICDDDFADPGIFQNREACKIRFERRFDLHAENRRTYEAALEWRFYVVRKIGHAQAALADEGSSSPARRGRTDRRWGLWRGAAAITAILVTIFAGGDASLDSMSQNLDSIEPVVSWSLMRAQEAVARQMAPRQSDASFLARAQNFASMRCEIEQLQLELGVLNRRIESYRELRDAYVGRGMERMHVIVESVRSAPAEAWKIPFRDL